VNVVVVNDFAQVNGGAAQVALSSANALSERGHAVTLFSAVSDPCERAQRGAVKVVCTHQHDIASDPSRARAALQGLWNLSAQRAIGELLAELDPRDTVVHFHGWTKALSSSVIRESLSRGFGAVTTLHEYFSACPNGGFFNYQQQAICPLVPLSAACITTHCDSRSYAQKLWRVGRQVVQRGAGDFPGGMRHFISVTDFSAAILRRYLPPDAAIHAVPNPIDVPHQPYAAVEDASGFVYVGRLSPEKGCLLLAKACSSLGVPLTFVGEGPMRDAIHSLYPAAKFTGWLSPEDVRAEITRARALALPSLWYETQGLVVNEAAALGVPAIVPDNCAARESVLDGVTGLWFRTADEADLKDKLDRLERDPALAAAMGKAAYQRFWNDPPTLERHVCELEKVYRQVLAAE
jgi:glycosyltransferase involved in cell wall biosynthesis